MIGNRIKQARTAAGLSLRELAERVDLSAMAISKLERGAFNLTSPTLLRLSKALGVRAEYFFRQPVELSKPEYRKRSSLGAKHLARIEAAILDQAERFVETLELFPTSPIAQFEAPAGFPGLMTSLEAIEDAAEAVRAAWSLGQAPISHLMDVLEERGILVLTTDADASDKFDGLAARVGGFPLLVVGEQWPGDRQRFTLAHELGHLLLSGRLAEGIDEEKACNRFAGAFLAPQGAVLAELGPHRTRLEVFELQSLKREYGLSMQAWVMRARDVGVIRPGVAETLFRVLASKGWRNQEPDRLPPERPGVFERLVIRAFAEDMISDSKAAELLSLSLTEFQAKLNLEATHAAPCQ